MSGGTVRIERTLPTGTLSPKDVETDADSTTVVKLPPLDLGPTRGDSEAGSEGYDQADSYPEDEISSAGYVQPDVREPERRWVQPLKSFAKVLGWLAVFPVLCILPFIVVLRISVLAYQENNLAGWESLGFGIIAAVLLVCVYIAVFMWTFGIRRRFFMPFLNVCLTAMLCYSGYALFHLATSNAKTEEVRTYYTSLHPFLRVAVKNLTLLDEDLVVTDTYRSKDKYVEMGLRPRDYSLHFRQSTGFVHAVDVRTKGRSKATNLLVELYFILMGFETIRHVGTADHLHVALPLVETDTLAASSDPDESD